MSRLTGLVSKGKVYSIGGLDLEIKPLGVEDFELMEIPEDASTKESMETLMKLVSKVLKDSIPDVTDEEIIKFVKMDHITEIQEAIMDVCGLNKTDKRTQLMKDRVDAIKARQPQK